MSRNRSWNTSGLSLPPLFDLPHKHMHRFPALLPRTSLLGHAVPPQKSQNHRGWQGPLWITQPNPLPKQGHPEQAAQDLVQAGLEYLQRRRLHSLPGQPGPGSVKVRYRCFPFAAPLRFFSKHTRNVLVSSQSARKHLTRKSPRALFAFSEMREATPSPTAPSGAFHSSSFLWGGKLNHFHGTAGHS